MSFSSRCFNCCLLDPNCESDTQIIGKAVVERWVIYKSISKKEILRERENSRAINTDCPPLCSTNTLTQSKRHSTFSPTISYIDKEKSTVFENNYPGNRCGN